MYQTPFADRIRNEVGIPTVAVGAIFEADHVNMVIAAGRADLSALARPHPAAGGGGRSLGADPVHGVMAAGRADLCAVARPRLADAAWTWHEAARIGHDA